MPGTLAFYQPRTLEETVGLLADLGDDAKVVAGSTAVTLLMRQGLIAPSALVDIGRLPGLDRIEIRDDALHLGALVRHRDIELDPLVRGNLPIVADTFGRVANVRVRNAATVGGVLAESDYASDPPAVFVALDATVEVLRACVGAAAETPQRFPDVEATAFGRPFDSALAADVADRYAERRDALDDMRGSAWYRTEMVRVWVRRALERAAQA